MYVDDTDIKYRIHYIITKLVCIYIYHKLDSRSPALYRLNTVDFKEFSYCSFIFIIVHV